MSVRRKCESGAGSTLTVIAPRFSELDTWKMRWETWVPAVESVQGKSQR